MDVKSYEKAFLVTTGLLLVVFLIALGIAALGMGITVPSAAGKIPPDEVTETPPFDDPGVHKVGRSHYEVALIGRAWRFEPETIRVPAGSKVTFKATSVDVVHGLKIHDTNVNVMLLPGQVTETTTTFDKAGKHSFICHEYCGVAHHTMYGQLIVEPRRAIARDTSNP